MTTGTDLLPEQVGVDALLTAGIQARDLHALHSRDIAGLMELEFDTCTLENSQFALEVDDDELEAKPHEILEALKALEDPNTPAKAKKQIRCEPNIQALLNMSVDRLYRDLENNSENSFSESQLTGSTIGSTSESDCDTSMRVLSSVPACEDGHTLGNLAVAQIAERVWPDMQDTQARQAQQFWTIYY